MLKALSQIILRNVNKDEREEAARLKKKLERFEFVPLISDRPNFVFVFVSVYCKHVNDDMPDPS